MEPSNGIMGDSNMGTSLPETPREDRDKALREVQKKAKYSRSKEFQELKEAMEARIEYYRRFLPGGVPVEQVNEEERGKYWAVANIIIEELQMVINQYEGAQQIIDDNK